MTKTAFQRETDSSDDVCDKLDAYDVLLKKWQKRFNLVGSSTIAESWQRHFFDSAQLFPLIKNKGDGLTVVDLGTGAGFPGLVLSIMGAGDVHLVESDANKSEFLRQAIRATGATATIHHQRIEQYQGPKADLITSRACAPLDKLLDLATHVKKENAGALFLKGRKWPDELTTAQAVWHINHQSHVSRTDPDSIILEISSFERI